MRYYFIILLFIFSAFPSKAETTYYGNYGQNIVIDISTGVSIESPEEVSIILEISNPSLVLPLVIKADEQEYTPEKISDQLYKFSFSENRITKDLNYQLVVKLLAGNDIECKIDFIVFQIGERSIQQEDIKIITQNIPRGVTYHRFPYISVASPNPVNIYQTATWTYRIDKPSRVTIKIFNLAGKMLERFEYLDVQAGYHTFEYIFNEDYSTGAYFIQLGTNHGSTISNFIIIK